MTRVIAIDDPAKTDVIGLLETHLAFANEVTPAGHVHALDVDRLKQPDITFFSVRQGGRLVGVGALKEIDPAHGEVKSMHAAAEVRGQGVGRAMVEHLLSVARDRGYLRLSLETGTYPAFDPARKLYEDVGFEVCEPFAEYTDNEFSVCMTISLD